MAWIRIDDQFADHPKFLDIRRDLADAALALWARALGYCNKQRTDGVIVRGAIYQLSCAKKPEAVAAELVRVGLWEETERGWLIHDYHVYQPHSGKAQATKEQLSAAGKKAASARWGRRANADATACDSHAPSSMPGCDPHATKMPPIPIPIPIPSPEISTGTLGGGSETSQPPRAPAGEPPPNAPGDVSPQVAASAGVRPVVAAPQPPPQDPGDPPRPTSRAQDLRALSGDARRVYEALLWHPPHWSAMSPAPLAQLATVETAARLATEAGPGGKLDLDDVLLAIDQCARKEAARRDAHEPPTLREKLAGVLDGFVGRMCRGEARERAAGRGRGGGPGARGERRPAPTPPSERAWQAQDAEISDAELAEYKAEDERRRAARRAGEQNAHGGAEA